MIIYCQDGTVGRFALLTGMVPSCGFEVALARDVFGDMVVEY
jgi:hypothetical protein